MAKSKMGFIFRVVIVGILVTLFNNCGNGFTTSNVASLGSILQTSPGSSPIASATPTPASTPTVGACATSSGAASNFPCSTYFNQNISSVTLSASDQTYSNTIISALATRGWGTGTFQVDESIDILTAPVGSPKFNVVNDSNWYAPDTDVIKTIPAPAGVSSAGFESSSGRTCDGGDCHYLVIDSANQQLIEVYGTNVSGTNLQNNGYGSIAVWPFNKVWPANYRGDVCTSADAGGLMIAPLLFSADELAAGAVNHAIRFILPNSSIASLTYARPATHTTGGSNWAPSSGSNMGVPYGSRLRLKNDAATNAKIANLPSAGARVVARGLQNYGMILADGGNIALTSQSDANTAHKYSDANIKFGTRDLAALLVTDFEVVPPPPIGVVPPNSTRNNLNQNVVTIPSLDCVRTP